MLARPLRPDERNLHNAVVNHPLQSWEWGEFRAKTGQKVERVGFFDNGKLVDSIQVTFHDIPVIHKPAGYCPKGNPPHDHQLTALTELAKEHQALFIKLEPNIQMSVSAQDGNHSQKQKYHELLEKHDAQPGRSLFTKHTFLLDLTKPEEEIFANLHKKTRYNTNLASRKGVQIYENSTAEGLENYIKILEKTTKRQGFYAHSPEYFRTMWNELGNTGMMRIFHAVYENTILTAWVMFIFNGVLYYPYGASVREHRDVMANNLMMWEMIRFGQSQGCHSFDMWGSLGPNADKSNPWYGFHKFKQGYSGELTESIGTYDLVANHQMYPLFKVAENVRWKVLRLRKKLGI